MQPPAGRITRVLRILRLVRTTRLLRFPGSASGRHKLDDGWVVVELREVGPAKVVAELRGVGPARGKW